MTSVYVFTCSSYLAQTLDRSEIEFIHDMDIHTKHQINWLEWSKEQQNLSRYIGLHTKAQTQRYTVVFLKIKMNSIQKKVKG